MMSLDERYRPAPRFSQLGEGFADVVEPARFPQHVLRFRNQRWAMRLGLGSIEASDWERHFGRFVPLPDNLEHPLALRYHGHQFGVYNPRLGDGRGFLFAQIVDPDDGRLLDLATKGSGQTPWSRDGDGRLTLKGGVREILASEMLEALGVPTSKAFSLFETGEALYRGDEPSPTRSSVLVRLGHSHIRFGTFQRYAALDDRARLMRLLEHVIETYMPGLDTERGDPAAAFFDEVCRRSARLVAAWMAAGFVHGVLNTDNMNVNGESFDYGPYRFLPRYDPEFVAAYFDPGGYYAFGRQPDAVRWNLAALAEALSPLSPPSLLRDPYEKFPERYRAALRETVLARLGLEPRGEQPDETLLSATFEFLLASEAGYEQFFFDWYGGAASEKRAAAGPAAAAYSGESFLAWRRLVESYRNCGDARLRSAYFAGERPCTLLIDEIESIWARIADADDWQPFETKIAAIRAMGDALSGACP